MEALRAMHPNESCGELDLERAIKWKFLLPILLLRKPPSTNGTKAKDLRPVVHRRLDQYIVGDWRGLVEDYERDVVLAWSVHDDNTRSQSDHDEANIWKAADLLSRFQYIKARKFLQSNGLGDHLDEHIVNQMAWKHPARKTPMSPLFDV